MVDTHLGYIEYAYGNYFSGAMNIIVRIERWIEIVT